MKILNFSGAATKIAAHAAIGRKIYENGFRPDAITGVSSGALVAIPLAMGKHDELERVTTELKLSDIFDKSPVKQNGKIHKRRAIYRLVAGKSSIGSQKNLYKTIRKMVSGIEWEMYRVDANMPDIYILTTDYLHGREVLYDLKEYDYATMLDILVASASIPIFAEGVRVNLDEHDHRPIEYDGGVYRHIASNLIYEKFRGRIEHAISVYSRPDQVDLSKLKFDKDHDIIQVHGRTLEIMQYAISEKDEESERLNATAYNFELQQIFAPSVLQSTYDTDSKRLRKLYNLSYQLDV